MSSKLGAIYIAFGEIHIRQALHSARSLKTHCSIPVTLFSDAHVESEFIDQVEVIDPGHKRAKIDYIDRSPYEWTVYLDSDTEVVMDLREDFSVLERFDIACVQDLSRKSSRWSKVITDYSNIPYAFPEYNGGVIFFRNTKTVQEFFDSWRRTFYQYAELSKGQDQPSFRIALWNSQLRIHALPSEYNVRNAAIRVKIDKRSKTKDDCTLMKPRILHWHGLDKKHPFAFLSKKYTPMSY